MNRNKRILQLVLFAIVGAVFGFLMAWLGEKVYAYLLANDVDMTSGSTSLAYGLLIVVALLLVYALITLRRITALSRQVYIGEAEDRVEVKKYKGMADYSLSVTLAMYVSLIPVSISILRFIQQDESVLLVISVILLMLSVISSLTIVKVGQLMDGERSYPKITDANFDKKLLSMMDEGERFVTFQGLYIAFQTTSALLVCAIPLMIGFSLITGQSQIFSITVVVIVLIISHSRYLLAIRKKY